MQASDAKACNFNFPTFKSAVCVPVLHRLPRPASIWSLILFFYKTQIVRFHFSLMEIKYHEAHRNTCTVFHKSSKGNEMFTVMGEDIFDAGSPITADNKLASATYALYVRVAVGVFEFPYGITTFSGFKAEIEVTEVCV